MLKPQPPAKPSMDLLVQAPNMDNNRLEKLVKNFVHEDKARLAAQAAASKTPKPMPSSIQYALRKFEKGAVVENGFSTNGPKKPGPAKKSPNCGPITVEQVRSRSLKSSKLIWNTRTSSPRAWKTSKSASEGKQWKESVENKKPRRAWINFCAFYCFLFCLLLNMGNARYCLW